jgi:protease IV
MLYMKNFLKNILIAIGFLSVLATVLFVIFMIVIVRKISSTDLELGSSKLSRITEDSNAVGVVELEGEINSSSDFREKLERFVSNDKIKAIVVRIDSPGGAVGASEEIYRYILDARRKKPVVCSLANIAASGGLYSSLGCEKVYTAEGTLTGSIGVILMLPNFKNVLDKVGVGFNVIKTGAYKDAGSPFREFEDQDREILEKVAMDAYDQFVFAVSKSRNIPVEKVREFADGRIILGAQAVTLGLADAIGGLKEASREALRLALKADEADTDPKLVFPPKKINLSEFLRNMNEQGSFSFIPDKYKSTTVRYQMM